MNHSAACLDAKSKHCHCECGGKYHGRKSGNLTDEVAKNINNLKVGDIVIIYSEGDNFGKRAFVDEIVRDPDERTGLLWHHGKYSLYGLEEAPKKQPYYGDHLGYQLEATGEKMTKGDLREYAEREPDNKGIALDMMVVGRNLGRPNGRNQN